MREFFRGWRRKFGVVALLLSCLFMAGWVRSLTFYESATIRFREDWTDEFASYDSSLIWGRVRTSVNSRLAPVFYSNRRSGDDGVWKRQFVQWHWQLLGFGHGSDGGGAKTIGIMTFHTSPSTVTVVPYWSIVLPLTLISLWLLLYKPHPSTQKKTPEPIPEKVT